MLKKRLAIIQDKKFSECLEEISFNKARKLLRRGYQFLKKEADEGRLVAMIEEDDKGKRIYHFTLSDIMRWQEKRKEETRRNYVGVLYVDPHWAKKYTENFHKSNPKTTKQIKEASL